MPRLIIVSNRTPGREPAAGGLAVALRKVLSDRQGFWFGWSGRLTETPSPTASFLDVGGLSVGGIDLTPAEHDAYYNGFSNSILWPAFHLRLDLANIEASWYEGYRRVNRRLAEALAPLLREDDLVWVHDYHLLPLATELRRLNVRNRLGFFLHIPFPTPDTLYAIPNHAELMRDLSRYDLVGMQARRDLAAFSEFHEHLKAAGEGSELKGIDFSGTEIDVFPIGTDPSVFARLAASPAATRMARKVQTTLGQQKLVLGIDRLDYSKGLPQRIEAFEKLLANNAELRRTVHMLQVATPSRDSIREYQDISDTLDARAGHVMGRFAEPDWQPLTYVKRTYGQNGLAGLYRLAKVGLVTPLRDGMNLVAHEYIAAQSPDDPGVLVLSRFAGAAELFGAALIVNPFDTDDTAEALRRALLMPLDERRERWQELYAAAETNNIDLWASRFIDRLSVGPPAILQGNRDVLHLGSTGSIGGTQMPPYQS